MVDPRDIERILTDAARLIAEGELVVFGSAALSFWLTDAPTTRDLDLWCEPAEKGDVVLALMGEFSWYHQRHGAFVEVWGPETFAAPLDWRERAKVLQLGDLPSIRLVVPHPHDVLMAKLERNDPRDVDHVRRILREFPLDEPRLDQLIRQMPHVHTGRVDQERAARFQRGLEDLRTILARRDDTSPSGA